MSQTNGAATGTDMQSVKQREKKLTQKCLLNKIENLENERKRGVDKNQKFNTKNKRAHEGKRKCVWCEKIFGKFDDTMGKGHKLTQ